RGIALRADPPRDSHHLRRGVGGGSPGGPPTQCRKLEAEALQRVGVRGCPARRPERTASTRRPRVKLVDTTVAVDHLRGAPAATNLLAGLITDGETLVASEITRFELLAGVRKAELDSLEAF